MKKEFKNKTMIADLTSHFLLYKLPIAHSFIKKFLFIYFDKDTDSLVI